MITFCKTHKRILNVGLALYLAGLLNIAYAGPGHSHSHSRPHAEEKSWTLINKDYELFMELPALVKGKQVFAIVHLTHLSDYKPVKQGIVEIEFKPVKGNPVYSAKNKPDKPGIFKTGVRLYEEGSYKVILNFAVGKKLTSFDLGKVYVANKATPAHEHGEEGSDISFLKEQQWIVDFAISGVPVKKIRESIKAYGSLRPRANGDVHISAPMSGRIEATAKGLPIIGSEVKQGDTLVHLIPRLGGDADIATLELTLGRAKSKFELMAKEYTRVQKLVKSGALAQKRLFKARQEYETARAEMKAAENRFARYGLTADAKSKPVSIRAPISGTLVQSHSVSGALLKEGQPLFHLVNLDRIWMVAQIPEVNINRITRPTGAWFLSPDNKIHHIDIKKNARLVNFGSVIDKTTRTVPLIFEFDNAKRNFRINTYVRVNIYTGVEKSALAVPLSAVIDDNGLDVVYVQKSGEAFEKRYVQLGVREAEWVEVKTGLKPGERVVSKGAYLVHLAGANKSSGGGHGHGHGHSH
jgi:RND family efflux transporter MFP subunit